MPTENANRNQKEIGTAILISDKTDRRTKNINMFAGDHVIVIKG